MNEEALRKWHVLNKQSHAFLHSVRAALVIETRSDLGFALVVTNDDDVFAIGHSIKKLPVQDGEKNLYKPRKIPALCQKKIKSFYHSIQHIKMFSDYNNTRYSPAHCTLAALSEDGKLFVWRRKYSELFYPSERYESFLLVEELANRKVVQFACIEKKLIFALTDRGKIFSVDSGGLERLPLSRSRKAVALACNMHSIFVLLKSGLLYSLGENGLGQLGIGENQLGKGRDGQPEHFSRFFIHVNGFSRKKIRQVVCGYNHSLALTDSGQIYAWGCNNMGQLGTGDTTNRHRPVLVASEFGRAVQIGAFEDQSVVKFEDGTVRVWGYSRNLYFGFQESEMRRGDLIDCATIDQAFAPHRMWKTLTRSLHKTVAQTLGLGLNDETTDACFRVGHQSVQAHKQVLVQSCRCFYAMLQFHWIEHSKRDFKVDQFSYDTFYAFMKYIYTEELTSNTHWENLSDLADYYGHQMLQDICQSEISRSKKDFEEEEEYDKEPDDDNIGGFIYYSIENENDYENYYENDNMYESDSDEENDDVLRDRILHALSPEDLDGFVDESSWR